MISSASLLPTIHFHSHLVIHGTLHNYMLHILVKAFGPNMPGTKLGV